jgi:predicted MFS family arabinose efflux permease
MNNLQKNIKLFYLINFLQACIFTTAIWSFFLTWFLTFSFSTALAIILVSSVVSFIFEIPSWAWADKFWRKKLFWLGIIFIILGFSFWIIFNSFYFFIFSQILIWIWYAITSGNLEALIHDNLEFNNLEKKFKDIQANAYIFLFMWRALSALVSWYLFVLNPYLPIYLTIIAYILILLFLFFINDKWQKLSKEINTTIHIKSSLKFILKERFIFYFIIILALFTATWNIYWFTYQPYFERIWISIENIWILFAITWIISAFWSFFIKKIQDYFTEKQIIFIMNILLIISSILFLQFSIFSAIIWLLIISIFFWFIMSFWNNVLIKKSPKTHKSTILSIFSFLITIWYSSFAFISGYIVDLYWLKILYFWNLLIILLWFIWSIFIFDKHKI